MTTPDEIDDLARALPPFVPEPARAESVRAGALAAAAGPGSGPATSIPRAVRVAAAVALPLAAAAGLLWYLASRGQSETAPVHDVRARAGEAAAPAERRVVSPRPGARYHRSLAGVDELVRLEEGGLDVEVGDLPAGGRLRVATAEAQVDAREARFGVEARAGRLVALQVVEGKVELRASRQVAAVVLVAGETWEAPARDALDAGPSADETAAADPDWDGRRGRPGGKVASAKAVMPPPPPPSKGTTISAGDHPVIGPTGPAAPGEAEFRSGWTALRAGEAGRAAELFAAARRAAGDSGLAEDAYFWQGMALARAGQAGRAIRALDGFLAEHPSSSRAGEAAARLGWLLVDAGRLDQAERRFRAAQEDRVPRVKKSARDGMDAIARRRGRP